MTILSSSIVVTCLMNIFTHMQLVKYTHLKNKKASNLSAGFFVKLKPRRLAYPHKLTAVVYHLESPLHQSQLYSSSLMMVIRT